MKKKVFKHKKPLSERYTLLMWVYLLMGVFPFIISVTCAWTGDYLPAVFWLIGSISLGVAAWYMKKAAIQAYIEHHRAVDVFWKALIEEGCILNAVQIDALIYSFPEYWISLSKQWTQNHKGDLAVISFYKEAYKMYVGLQQTDMARYLASFMWANKDLWYQNK